MICSIRVGLFETNSSSCHTLIFATKEEYTKFKNKELLYNFNINKFTTYEEAKQDETHKIYKEADIVVFGGIGYDG